MVVQSMALFPRSSYWTNDSASCCPAAEMSLQSRCPGLADWLPTGGEISDVAYGSILGVTCLFTQIYTRPGAALVKQHAGKSLLAGISAHHQEISLPQELTPIRDQGREQTLQWLTQLPTPSNFSYKTNNYKAHLPKTEHLLAQHVKEPGGLWVTMPTSDTDHNKSVGGHWAVVGATFQMKH